MKFNGSQPRYSEATMARAVERYASGESPTTIGRELGCSSRSVRDWAKARGVHVRSMREAAAVYAQRETAARDARKARGEDPKPTGPAPRNHTNRSPFQDDDEEELDPRVLTLPPTPSGAEIALTLVETEGELRIVARAVLRSEAESGPQVVQHSWEADDVHKWGRGLLALFARAASPAKGKHREARHVR